MKGFWQNTWKHRAHVIMCLPAFILLLMFAYIPIVGLTMAFRDYDMAKGIWNSPWNNFENFKFLITSGSIFLRMTRNTLMYYAIFTIVGTSLNIILAISIDQFVFKKLGKVYQSIMIIPVFISYAAVTFIVSAFFRSGSANNGIINNIIQALGGENIGFYTNSKYWPGILTGVKIWNSVGYGSVLYMSVLAGIDTELYEAAQIDGAGKWKQIIHITLPSLVPMITIMLLLSVGGIMRSDTGLFYQVTRNSGILHETTQVIDSYILNSLSTVSNFGFTTAASLYQSVVGLVMILAANGIVRKAAPDNALF